MPDASYYLEVTFININMHDWPNHNLIWMFNTSENPIGHVFFRSCFSGISRNVLYQLKNHKPCLLVENETKICSEASIMRAKLVHVVMQKVAILLNYYKIHTTNIDWIVLHYASKLKKWNGWHCFVGIDSKSWKALKTCLVY